MCVPVMIDFSFIMFRNRYYCEIYYLARLGFISPDDQKTQYIDRPYRLGGGGLQNSLRKTIFVI